MEIVRTILATVLAVTTVVGAPAPATADPAVPPVPAAVAAADAAAAQAAATGPAMVSGYAVYDRQRRVYTQWHLGNKRFRSASVVKLLIALDVLWHRNPAEVSPADRGRLARMLRSSDDNAANYFWVRRGQRQIVQRMARRIGLNNTVPPPPSLAGWWGYTAMTPRDAARTYWFILERARVPVRNAIMWQLHHATPRGTDGFHQNFGFLTFPAPRSAKQGWSGFGGRPPAGARIPGVSLWAEALHTTGTVGPRDRYIVALFTLHRRGTPQGTARARTTRLAQRIA